MIFVGKLNHAISKKIIVKQIKSISICSLAITILASALSPYSNVAFGIDNLQIQSSSTPAKISTSANSDEPEQKVEPSNPQLSSETTTSDQSESSTPNPQPKDVDGSLSSNSLQNSETHTLGRYKSDGKSAKSVDGAGGMSGLNNDDTKSSTSLTPTNQVPGANKASTQADTGTQHLNPLVVQNDVSQTLGQFSTALINNPKVVAAWVGSNLPTNGFTWSDIKNGNTLSSSQNDYAIPLNSGVMELSNKLTSKLRQAKSISPAFSPESHSVSIWIKPKSFSATPQIFSFNRGSLNSELLNSESLWVTPDGNLLFWDVIGSTYVRIDSNGKQKIKLNEWNQITVTRNANATNNLNFYINGVNVGSYTTTANKTIIFNDFTIGADAYASSGQINGSIGQITIYNEGLSQNEVQTNFNFSKPFYIFEEKPILSIDSATLDLARPYSRLYLSANNPAPTSIKFTYLDNSANCKVVNADLLVSDIGSCTIIATLSKEGFSSVTTIPLTINVQKLQFTGNAIETASRLKVNLDDPFTTFSTLGLKETPDQFTYTFTNNSAECESFGSKIFARKVGSCIVNTRVSKKGYYDLEANTLEITVETGTALNFRSTTIVVADTPTLSVKDLSTTLRISGDYPKAYNVNFELGQNTAGCSILGIRLTAKTLGSCTVRAIYSKPGYKISISESLTINVNKIDFDGLPNIVTVGPAISLGRFYAPLEVVGLEQVPDEINFVITKKNSDIYCFLIDDVLYTLDVQGCYVSATVSKYGFNDLVVSPTLFKMHVNVDFYGTNLVPKISPKFHEWNGGKALVLLSPQSKILFSNPQSSLMFAPEFFHTNFASLNNSLIVEAQTLQNELVRVHSNLIGIQKLGVNSIETKTVQRGIPVNIYLKYDATAGKGNSDGYTIQITENGIIISAPTSTGIYYGGRTLLKMLRSNEEYDNYLPVSTIVDYPDSIYRSQSLDISSHKYSMSYLKDTINQLSWVNMNNLTLNLLDSKGFALNDPGSKYSKLSDGQTGLSYAQIQELILWGKQHHVNITPSFQINANLTPLTELFGIGDSCINNSVTTTSTDYNLDIISTNAKDELLSFIKHYTLWFSSPFVYLNSDTATNLNCYSGNIFGNQLIQFVNRISGELLNMGKLAIVSGRVSTYPSNELLNDDVFVKDESGIVNNTNVIQGDNHSLHIDPIHNIRPNNEQISKLVANNFGYELSVVASGSVVTEPEFLENVNYPNNLWFARRILGDRSWNNVNNDEFIEYQTRALGIGDAPDFTGAQSWLSAKNVSNINEHTAYDTDDAIAIDYYGNGFGVDNEPRGGLVNYLPLTNVAHNIEVNSNLLGHERIIPDALGKATGLSSDDIIGFNYVPGRFGAALDVSSFRYGLGLHTLGADLKAPWTFSIWGEAHW